MNSVTVLCPNSDNIVTAAPYLPQHPNITYKIQGGQKVDGFIECMGAKNLVTKLMVASLLAKGKTIIHNVPFIGEVEITMHLLRSLGAEVNWVDENTLEINPQTLSSHRAFLPDSRTNRIPILLLSTLLHVCGKATVPIVGGDDIGKRNVDFHIKAIEDFGATVEMEDESYVAFLPEGEKLKGCHIHLPYPSVGATETCLFLSVLARGISVIHNVAIEPEIIEIITMLRSMGAIIFLNANRTVTVHGVEQLRGTQTTAICDRLEAASWAALACASDGKITVKGIRPDLLGNFLSYYTLVGGGHHIINSDTVEFFRAKKELLPAIIETDVFPGFSTDYQQTFALILTQAAGMSVIHETVYEQRFGYLKILNKLGAKTQTVEHCLGSSTCRYRDQGHHHSAIIQGITPLQAIASPISVPDIRAGLAYLIAAALAKGETTLTCAEQLERGYGQLDIKLKNTSLALERFSASEKPWSGQ